MDTIKDLLNRRLELKADIRSIQSQLAARKGDTEENQRWRAKAIASMNFKTSELEVVNDEVTHLRRRSAAKELDIRNENDPRELLLALRAAAGRYLDGCCSEQKLRKTIGVVDRYFEHSGEL